MRNVSITLTFTASLQYIYAVSILDFIELESHRIRMKGNDLLATIIFRDAVASCRALVVVREHLKMPSLLSFTLAIRTPHWPCWRPAPLYSMPSSGGCPSFSTILPSPGISTRQTRSGCEALHRICKLSPTRTAVSLFGSMSIIRFGLDAESRLNSFEFNNDIDFTIVLILLINYVI